MPLISRVMTIDRMRSIVITLLVFLRDYELKKSDDVMPCSCDEL
jgi:hypothetical protein